MSTSHLAVDWSGAKTGGKIWLAEVRDHELVRFQGGWSRDALLRFLKVHLRGNPDIVLGFDFAFSLPLWFVEELGALSGPEVWRAVEANGEEWLSACEPPFWGRPGRGRPERPEARPGYRRTENEVSGVGGIRPKSVFQIGGAGAVGTGALRGMPYLLELREAGCAIWPFDPPDLPLVVEIYPRLLTGEVVKGDAGARKRYLDERYLGLRPDHRELAISSEDAFDALVSAFVMADSGDAFSALPAARDQIDRLEGRIWRPGLVPPPPGQRAAV